jgi:hypothetical protein
MQRGEEEYLVLVYEECAEHKEYEVNELRKSSC